MSFSLTSQILTAGPVILVPFIFITGLAFGSFASVLVPRLINGGGIFFARSECPSCKRNLKAWQLIPLFSWLWQKGKCGFCGVKISIFYPIIEIAMAVTFTAIYLKYSLSLNFFIFCSAAFLLITIIAIDLRYKLIPDVLQIILLFLGIFYAFCRSSEISAMEGAALGATLGFGLRWIFFYWKNKESLGMGDVKFLIVSGVFLGPQGLLPFIFFAGILGLVTAFFWNRLKLGHEFPFAPALAASLFLCLTVPEISQLFWKIYDI